MPHLLSLSDLGAADLMQVLDRAERHRELRGKQPTDTLRGKSIALVFEKASTRTRISLEVAVAELGGHPIVITSQGSQMGRGEPIRDTARVLCRMVHGITFRTSGDERLREMAEFSSVPVLNALTDSSHPMQLLADLMTVRRLRGDLTQLTFAWVGDGNNMAASWIEAAGLLKLKLRLGCPPGFSPKAAQVDAAVAAGGDVEVVVDAARAVAGADVVSTDVFTSMGQETEAKARNEAFRGYRLTQELLSAASSEVVVLHCLPAHRGEEIDDAVLEGSRSFVWDQAEARLHTAKAALEWALGERG
jgi:ornithine carbamoyltransferase